MTGYRKYRVETIKTVRCIFFVNARDEDEAVQATADTQPDLEETENEETMSITAVKETV